MGLGVAQGGDEVVGDAVDRIAVGSRDGDLAVPARGGDVDEHRRLGAKHDGGSGGQLFGQRDLAEDAELGECELRGRERRAAQLQEPVAQRELVERGRREAGDPQVLDGGH